MKEYKRLFVPLLQEKLLLIVSICSGMLAAAMNVSRPLLMGLIIDRLMQKHIEEVYIYIALFVGSRLITWGNSLLFDYVCSKGSQRILRKQHIALLYHFLSLPFAESEKVKQGELETLVVSDIPNWARLYESVLIECIHAIAQFIGALIAFQHIDIQFVWLTIPFLIASATIPMFMVKKVRKMASIAQMSHSSVVETISRFVKGIQDLRSLRGEKWAVKQFEEVTSHSYKSEVKKIMMQRFIGVMGTAIETGAYMIVLIVGAQKVIKGEMEVGSLVAILATIEMLFFPVRYASDLLMMTQVSVASANRVWRFLDRPIETVAEERGTGIEVINASFKNLLINVQLQINPGELIAIVGESGAGKTTLLKLLTGLYKPTSGGVEYYGEKGKMTSVWQEPRLFRATIKENLIFQSDVAEEQLKQSMEIVNAGTIIKKLPNGMQTILEREGESFSGGERKRLALWRAIVLKPNVVILDEPTAGLDPNNQEIVWNMIKSLGRNVTRIVATHDRKHAMEADRIVVMKKGRVVEFGKPQELLNRNSLLKEMLMK
ncbi:ABC transporter ATP-binding protein [Bacillus sp. C1]